MNRLPPRSRGCGPKPRWLGRVLALLALVLQLATASMVPMPALAAAPASLAGFDAAGFDAAGFDLGAPICHSPDVTKPDGGSTPQQHHACDTCALCQSIAQGGAPLLPGPAALAPPVRLTGAGSPLPPVRAPPQRRLSAATSPRGPPAAV